jgi:hypothetical protein
MTARHRHRPVRTETRPFFGPVARPENRAAHGNVTLVQHCACGAVRRINVNGQREERGKWQVTP